MLRLRVKARDGDPMREMLRTFAGIEAHGVEIGYRDGPAFGFESIGAGPHKLRVERLRFRMGEHKMSVDHRGAFARGGTRFLSLEDTTGQKPRASFA